MWWRFSLLIGALVASSFVYALGLEAGREARLAFSDGTPVTGVQVRWLDEQDQVGFAEEMGPGTWRIPLDAVALEVVGESVADSLVAWEPGKHSATLARPARLEVRVEGPAPVAAPLRLHVLGSLHGFNQRPRQERELRRFWALDSPDSHLAHTSGGLRYRFMGSPDPATLPRSATPRATHNGLRWERGGTECRWMPALPEQLTAEAQANGIFLFDELPAGAEVVLLADPSCGVTLRELGREEQPQPVHGVTRPLQLTRDPEVAIDLALESASELVLEEPPSMDSRSMIVLERRVDASDAGALRWERLGRLDRSRLGRMNYEFSFKRLEPGTYRLGFEEYAEGEWHAWVGAERWTIGPGETVRVPLTAQLRPADHVPLELRICEAASGSTHMLWLSSDAELGENLCFELDLRDASGSWEPWVSWRGRVLADGRLSPQPWIPRDQEVRVRLREDYRRRFESHGQWLLRESELEQVLGAGSADRVLWTLNVDPAP